MIGLFTSDARRPYLLALAILLLTLGIGALLA